MSKIEEKIISAVKDCIQQIKEEVKTDILADIQRGGLFNAMTNKSQNIIGMTGSIESPTNVRIKGGIITEFLIPGE